MDNTQPPKFSGNEQARQYPRFAWLFDIDGVLTDPEAKRITKPEIFDELASRLQKGEPLGFNTGRSTDFIIKAVLNPLEERIGANRILLQNLFAVGEKGGVWIKYDTNGSRETHIDEQFKIPQILKEEVKKLVSQPPYSEMMFYDETKQTMISIELNSGKKIEEFKTIQQQLSEAVNGVILQLNLLDNYRVEPARIAIDIENKLVGKALGAKKFVSLLQERKIDPEEYICFGDTASDYDMYKELRNLEKKSQLVFVGGREQLTDKDLEGVTFTWQRDDKGTLEYLQKV
jgi:hydroxymethylpyrimidine pyrophosphatase-like HAD family hydrolase